MGQTVFAEIWIKAKRKGRWGLGDKNQLSRLLILEQAVSLQSYFMLKGFEKINSSRVSVILDWILSALSWHSGYMLRCTSGSCLMPYISCEFCQTQTHGIITMCCCFYFVKVLNPPPPSHHHPKQYYTSVIMTSSEQTVCKV